MSGIQPRRPQTIVMKEICEYFPSGEPLTLYTDHKSRSFSSEKSDMHGGLVSLLDLILDYWFIIVYWRGSSTPRASWLSRKERKLNINAKFFMTSIDARDETNRNLLAMFDSLASVEIKHFNL